MEYAPNADLTESVGRSKSKSGAFGDPPCIYRALQQHCRASRVWGQGLEREEKKGVGEALITDEDSGIIYLL